MHIPPHVTIQKAVGETPLEAIEAWRAAQPPAYQHLPLAYAGRLDPMASGTLLVLIGDECKVQTQYHQLDKGYDFSILLGVASDTHDVLGRLTFPHTSPAPCVPTAIANTLKDLTGTINLPYPHFSSKTVAGKPLHTWTLEGRLTEITIPTNTTTVYRLTLQSSQTLTREEVAATALHNINRIPPVTDPRKALGNDFRRVDVRADWQQFLETGHRSDSFTILHVRCIASSGTYMRSLAHTVGQRLGQPSLAFRIHRTTIGTYRALPYGWGYWTKRF